MVLPMPVVAAQPQDSLARPAPGRRHPGVQASPAHGEGSAQRVVAAQPQALPVAAGGALFVTGQARGDRQDDQQLGPQAAEDGGRGQDRQPVFAVGDGPRQVTGEQADVSRAQVAAWVAAS